MTRDIALLALAGTALLSVLFNLYQVRINRMVGKDVRLLKRVVTVLALHHQLTNHQNPPVDVGTEEK
jgi:hypothetical protein